MILTLLVIVYLIGLLVLLRKIPGRFARLVKEDDDGQVIQDIIASITAAIVWPIIVIGAVAYVLSAKRYRR